MLERACLIIGVTGILIKSSSHIERIIPSIGCAARVRSKQRDNDFVSDSRDALIVDGEYRHRKANANLAKSLGIPKENVFMLHSGDVLEVSEQEAKVVDKVHTGEILVDGLGVGDVGNIVLRDRQHLAEDGIMIVVLTLERGSNQLLAGPDIVSRGFVYVRESEDLMEEARQVVTDAVEDCLNHQRNADWSKIKLVIRDTMNEFIWKKTKRRPMILPIIMDV